eukprot:TRINITY_DN60922_c0_g1_i2.p1 TRINITY_DN60922_c0_g1~~TRINITY_DN60922_c0_g1_i2.p1  ORF type:complete len:117 (+),score=19.36 TRINITY_DN60922_c0_g1_i2:534-884(+)
MASSSQRERAESTLPTVTAEAKHLVDSTLAGLVFLGMLVDVGRPCRSDLARLLAWRRLGDRWLAIATLVDMNMALAYLLPVYSEHRHGATALDAGDREPELLPYCLLYTSPSPRDS